MKRIYLLFYILLYAGLNASAQTGKVLFEHLNMRNGLPADYVSGIVQDGTGFMWLGNGEYLVRYDGHQLKSYPIKSDKNNYYNSFIVNIALNRQKNPSVYTYGGAVYRYDPKVDSLELERANFPRRGTNAFFVRDVFSDRKWRNWSFVWNNKDKNIQLNRLDPDKKTTWFGNKQKGKNFLNADTVNVLAETTSGLWLGTSNGLYQFDEQQQTFNGYLTSGDKYASMNVVQVYQAPSDPKTLWLITKLKKDKTYKLCSFNEHYKMLKICASISGFVKVWPQFAIFEDKNKRLWYTSTKGLTQYEPITGKETLYPFGDNIKLKEAENNYNITQDKHGIIWLASAFGVIRFDPDKGTYEQFRANPSDPDALAHNHVTQILHDRSGEMWVSMDEYGLDRVNSLRSAFTVYKNDPQRRDSYPENTTGIAQGAKGGFWVTSQNGLFQWDVKANSFEQVSDLRACTAPMVSKDGTLYVSSLGKMQVYKNGNMQAVSMPAAATCFYEDRKANIWIIANNNTLYTYNKSKSIAKPVKLTVNRESKFLAKDSVDSYFTSSMVEDMKGNLWLYHSKLGLCKATVGDSTTTLTAVPNTRNFVQDVNMLYLDKTGNFWICSTTQGMCLVDRAAGKIIGRISKKNGLQSNNIHDAAEDDFGNIWISTERGLAKYNLKRRTLLNYSVADNIPFDVPMSIVKSRDGKMVNAMFNSMLVFDPADLKSNPYPPQVVIENILAQNADDADAMQKNINPFSEEEVELPHNLNRLTFNYAALHYANPAQNQYLYMLEGYDKQWVKAGTEHSVTYNNLASGTYTFKVKASNSDGVWAKKETTYTFVINKPWYKRWWAWLLYIVVFGVVLYRYIEYRSEHLKQQNERLEEKIRIRTGELSLANVELQHKQEEITTQRDRLAESVEHLTATQNQLIQAEKMASLGELTAGIAHEIQNPLNFVNNFSEVSIELVDEMGGELARGDIKEAMNIAADVKLNLGKISQHGKRADMIVKGMLQHSRTSTGEKQQVNINTLADEYLKLAYHGLRAKNKTFNAQLVTNFKKEMPLVKIVPQDIGRVLLNLFNNAFYAVQQKQKTAGEDFKPTVEVGTKFIVPPNAATDSFGMVIGAWVVITVRDNGTGIPAHIKDKIMQPFFTTKPTGEGTGLGLSLSYDMVVKGHGGKIEINTREGEFTEFVITLPA